MEADFKGFVVEPTPAPLTTWGNHRIVAWTIQPLEANWGIRAWVGDQELSAISVDDVGFSLEGFVPDPPADADTFKYQIDGEDQIETNLTATPEPGNV